MNRRLHDLEQRYNALLAEIKRMDDTVAAGKIDPDNTLFFYFYQQACKARDRLLDQIKVQKINITLHEQKHGFPLADNNQLKLNLVCDTR